MTAQSVHVIPTDPRIIENQRLLPMLMAVSIAWLAWLGGGHSVDSRVIPYFLLTVAVLVANWNGLFRPRATSSALMRWVWVPAIAAGLATLWSVNRYESYSATLAWVAFATAATLGWLEGRQGLGRGLLWISAGLAVAPVFGLIQLAMLEIPGEALSYLYKNTTGICMAVLFLLAWARQLHGWASAKSVRSVRTWWPSLLGLLGTLFLWHSHSRGSILATGMALIIGCALLKAEWRVRGLVLGAVYFSAGYPLTLLLRALPLLAGGNSQARILSLPSVDGYLIAPGDNSFDARIQLWLTAWDGFKARPWGWGPGTFGDVYWDFVLPGRTIYARSSHSLLFSSLFEAGPILLLGLLGIGFSLLWLCWRHWKRVPSAERPLAAGAFAAISALAGHAMIDFSWDFPVVLVTVGGLVGLLGSRLFSLVESETKKIRTRTSHRASRARPWLPIVVVAVFVAGVLRPYSARELVQQGRQMLQAKKYVEAANRFRSASMLDPLDSVAPSWLGQAYLDRWRASGADDDLMLAKESTEKAISKAPRIPELHHLAAMVYRDAKETDQYQKHMQDGLQYGPFYLPILVELAEADLARGEVLLARKRLEWVADNLSQIQLLYSASFLAQWRPRARLALAHAYLAEKDLDKARDQLEQLQTETASKDSQAYRSGVELLAKLKP